LWFWCKNYAQTPFNEVSFLSLSDYSENPQAVKIKITVIAASCSDGGVWNWSNEIRQLKRQSCQREF
jgi:hypothetical protein